MKFASIPSSWVGWTGRMDADHLLAVKDELEARGLDATAENVRQVSKDVQFAADAQGTAKQFSRRRK